MKSFVLLATALVLSQAKAQGYSGGYSGKPTGGYRITDPGPNYRGYNGGSKFPLIESYIPFNNDPVPQLQPYTQDPVPPPQPYVDFTVTSAVQELPQIYAPQMKNYQRKPFDFLNNLYPQGFTLTEVFPSGQQAPIVPKVSAPKETKTLKPSTNNIPSNVFGPGFTVTQVFPRPLAQAQAQAPVTRQGSNVPNLGGPTITQVFPVNQSPVNQPAPVQQLQRQRPAGPFPQGATVTQVFPVNQPAPVQQQRQAAPPQQQQQQPQQFLVLFPQQQQQSAGAAQQRPAVQQLAPQPLTTQLTQQQIAGAQRLAVQQAPVSTGVGIAPPSVQSPNLAQLVGQSQSQQGTPVSGPTGTVIFPAGSLPIAG